MGVAALVGKRVSLRPFRDGDSAAVEAWYQEAVAVAGIPHPRPLSRSAGEGRSVDSLSGSVLIVERVGESGPIGVLEFQVAGGWLTVGFIGLAKAYRGWGYGSEAVRLVEEWAVREGIAERFRAEIPVRSGLGLYFWLRLGYRPKEPSGGRDTMEMVRET
jgi:GNAT superfamily N-acetyltransferase